MDEPSHGVTPWSLAMALVGIGGALGLVGALGPWFDVTGWLPTQLFGDELVAVRTLAGTGDWTGIVALAAGAGMVALVAVALLFHGSAARHWAPTVSVVFGLLVLVAAVAAYLRTSSVATGVDFGRIGTVHIRSRGAAGPGLFTSAVGGALAGLAGLITRRLTPEM